MGQVQRICVQGRIQSFFTDGSWSLIEMLAFKIWYLWEYGWKAVKTRSEEFFFPFFSEEQIKFALSFKTHKIRGGGESYITCRSKTDGKNKKAFEKRKKNRTTFGLNYTFKEGNLEIFNTFKTGGEKIFTRKNKNSHKKKHSYKKKYSRHWIVVVRVEKSKIFACWIQWKGCLNWEH